MDYRAVAQEIAAEEQKHQADLYWRVLNELELSSKLLKGGGGGRGLCRVVL